MNQAPETIEVGKLRKRAEFQYVQKGVRSGRATLAAQARRRAPADTPDNGPPRVGFTATKKIGNAVVRNRAKRRLREAARRMVPLYGRPGVDYVFLARDTTGDAPWQALLDDMKDALLRLAAALERSA
ncbi:MAG: ribonuclease P protein component [Hyphomonadaceae bacterium]|nr:ribonuclease P protein component [Hyphomonadaceae bacterium]